jgi:purine catabolism regulator
LGSVVEGELVIIPSATLHQQKDVHRDLAWIIGKLVEARVRALCIQGPVTVTALEAAARNQMTAIYLPDDAQVDKAERGVIRTIMELQNQLEQRDQELQQELIRHVTSGHGLPQIIKALANTVSLPVVLHDTRRLRLAYGLPDADEATATQWKQQFCLLKDNDLVAHFSKQTKPGRSDSAILESAYSLSLALHQDSEIFGYLSFLKNATALDDFASIALNRGAVVCTLLLAKQRTVDSTERRSRSDWISAWLEGHATDDHLILNRAEQSGFSPDQVYVIMTMRWTPGRNAKRPLKTIRPEQLTEQVRYEISNRRISAIVGQYVDRTVVFMPLEKAQHTGRMKQYARSICDRMTELLSGNIVCGVGRPGVGLTELRRSFEEAERAMTLSDQLWDESCSNFFGDLSLTELLLNVQDYQQLQRFCHDWLSNILTYDQQNHSDLLLTMSVYFANNGNMAATAKQLNVHRNTLVYRLNRIAEITQLDMDDADVQLNLHLAIKAYHLLETLGLE